MTSNPDTHSLAPRHNEIGLRTRLALPQIKDMPAHQVNLLRHAPEPFQFVYDRVPLASPHGFSMIGKEDRA
jgi:hypothetical protein